MVFIFTNVHTHVHSLKHLNSFTRHILKPEILWSLFPTFISLFLLVVNPLCLKALFCYFLLLSVLGRVSTQSQFICVVQRNYEKCLLLLSIVYYFLRQFLLNSTRKEEFSALWLPHPYLIHMHTCPNSQYHFSLVVIFRVNMINANHSWATQYTTITFFLSSFP